MARRRFQDPKPFRNGNWWYIQIRRDEFEEGKATRKKVWVKLAPAEKNEREVLKIAAEYLRPMNQGLVNVGSATSFTSYVNDTYIPVVLPTMATTTQGRYKGIITNYLEPAFGKLCLRDLTHLTIQRYISGLDKAKVT